MTVASWSWWATVVLRLLLGTGGWWAITEADGSMAGYGLAAVPLAVAVSVLVLPPSRSRGRWGSRAAAFAALLGWFLTRSVTGAVDVSRRALTRRVDLDPGFVTHRFTSRSVGVRVAVVDLMNLMPGSLSARLDGDVLELHVLDVAMPVPETVAELERRVAAVAGEPW